MTGGSIKRSRSHLGLLAELRRRARNVVGPAIGLCAIAYFAYHVFHGDRGLVAWRSLEQRIAVASQEAEALRQERQQLEHRVGLLHPDRLDPDMLDESARRMLNYGLADDIVIFDTPPNQR